MSTLSTTGQFVTTGLSSEKINRDEENDIFQYPVGIASTAVNEYQLVSKELDLEILQNISGQIQIINNKKKDAIGLGNSAGRKKGDNCEEDVPAADLPAMSGYQLDKQ